MDSSSLNTQGILRNRHHLTLPKRIINLIIHPLHPKLARTVAHANVAGKEVILCTTSIVYSLRKSHLRSVTLEAAINIARGIVIETDYCGLDSHKSRSAGPRRAKSDCSFYFIKYGLAGTPQSPSAFLAKFSPEFEIYKDGEDVNGVIFRPGIAGLTSPNRMLFMYDSQIRDMLQTFQREDTWGNDLHLRNLLRDSLRQLSGSGTQLNPAVAPGRQFSQTPSAIPS